MDITNLTLSEAAGRLYAATISPIALTQAHLDRIEQLDPILHSFITRTEAEAHASALIAETDIAHKRYRGPLQGIPLAVKDVFDVEGVPTTAGSPCFTSSIAQRDAAVVRRLKERGAVIVGKSNMSEWAMKASSSNATFGDCANPWNLAYGAGGSSSGSAAAVAARLCLGALGSDTGGSVRIPASACGVVGFKPGYGRISTHGMIPLSRSLDHVGLLAPGVCDVAILLQELAGYDNEDLSSQCVAIDEYVAHPGNKLPGWRIAVAYQPFLRPGEQADEEILQSVDEAVRVFERLGAHIQEVTLPQGPTLRDANSLILMSEAAAYHRERLQNTPEAFGEGVLESLKQGLVYTAIDSIQALEVQRQGKRWFEHFFDTHDLLLLPTLPTIIPRLLDGETEKNARPSLTAFTSAWNLLGVPALSLPCGFTSTNLPLGLQITGPWWAEARVLCAGFAYEQATPWHKRKAPLL